MIFRKIELAAVAGMIAVLSACATVGPNYVKPAPLPPQAKATVPLSFGEADGWRLAQPKAAAGLASPSLLGLRQTSLHRGPRRSC